MSKWIFEIKTVEKLGWMWKTAKFLAKNSSQVCMLASEQRDCDCATPIKTCVWVWPCASCGQWDISKHNTDETCALGTALSQLWGTLQLPPCGWAQANLQDDERNVIITPADTAPTTRWEWGHWAPAELTKTKTAQSAQRIVRNLGH